MDTKKTGRLIAKKRNALKFSQGKLSEMLMVAPQAVSAWERGLSYPDASSQVMIHKVLGLNPVELLTGLEMFDDDLKRGIDSHMKRIDEKVFVAGNVTDEDGNEFYLDLSEFNVVTNDKNGELSDKWIPFTDYYNVELPKEKREEEKRTPYDPSKIYLNHGPSILVIPVGLLELVGRPLYFNIYRDRKRGRLLIACSDQMRENGFDIPEKVYNGKWKGVMVHGGEYGHVLCAELGVRNYFDLLEAEPIIDPEKKIVAINLDELKRSSAEVISSDFLLPQRQYDELAEEDEEWDEDE